MGKQRPKNLMSSRSKQLTNDGTLVILVRIESCMFCVWGQMIVRMLDHVATVGDLALFERALVDVDVGVVLLFHFYLFLFLF